MRRSFITAIIFLSVFLSLPVAASDRNPVRKVSFEPLEMHFGDSLRTGFPFSKDPTVIRQGKYYYMYYSVQAYSKDRKPSPDIPDSWHSGIARSEDLVNWTSMGDMVLYDTKGERIWGAVAPCVKKFGGKIHLFYQRGWKGASNNNNNLWHAVSDDGLTFRNTCDEPIIVPRTSWSTDRSIDAEVYRVKDKLILLFATRDPGMVRQMIGMAEAPYGSDYGPDKWTLLSVDGPFLQPEYPWEGKCIEASTVLKYKGVYYMFYAGSYNHEHQQIGLATSLDGRRFERYGIDGLVFRSGRPGSWNYGESGHPGIFQDRDGKVYLFFQGKDSRNGDYTLSVARVSFLRH